MQLEVLNVKGLFDHFDHEVVFPTSPEDDEAAPSLVILHGRNGVGKTTILRMIDGLMRLDFDVFREVPFTSCSLRFTTGDFIAVTDARVNSRRAFDIAFESPMSEGDSDSASELFPEAEQVVLSEGPSGGVRRYRVMLDGRPGRKGALNEPESLRVEEFRRLFFEKTAPITFEYIATTRRFEDDDQSQERHYTRYADITGEVIARTPRQRERVRTRPPLASKVGAFVESAQLDYRRFFATTEPELFPRIMQRLASDKPATSTAEELADRLQVIQNQESKLARLGLEVEQWDYESLMGYLRSLSSLENREYGLAVLAAYTEVLESRAEQRQLVADRLLTFEEIMNDFLLDKKVFVDPERGLRIETDEGRSLREDRLSSGEYHLLYLMVSALVTRRRGTVIAIDEPEMSMHIAWQRKLIPNLLRCASNAAPQFIFATHSPDIVAEYRSSLIRIGPREEEAPAST